MSGLRLFLWLRSVPLVLAVSVLSIMGFTAFDHLQIRWGQIPLRVDVPLASFEPVLLALLFFVTQFSPMSTVDALGGARMLRRRFALHAGTVGATVLLLLVASTVRGSSDVVLTVRNYFVYAVMASAAGLVLRELGFALVIIYWVFCSMFGLTPERGAEWWAVPYRDGGLTSWLTATVLVLVFTLSCVAAQRLQGDVGD